MTGPRLDLFDNILDRARLRDRRETTGAFSDAALGFGHGLSEVGYGVGKLGTRLFDAVADTDYTRALQESEDNDSGAGGFYDEQGTAGAIGRGAGKLAGELALWELGGTGVAKLGARALPAASGIGRAMQGMAMGGEAGAALLAGERYGTRAAAHVLRDMPIGAALGYGEARPEEDAGRAALYGAAGAGFFGALAPAGARVIAPAFGAAVGAQADKEHPFRGAALGAAAGYGTYRTGRAGANLFRAVRDVGDDVSRGALESGVQGLRDVDVAARLDPTEPFSTPAPHPLSTQAAVARRFGAERRAIELQQQGPDAPWALEDPAPAQQLEPFTPTPIEPMTARRVGMLRGEELTNRAAIDQGLAQQAEREQLQGRVQQLGNNTTAPRLRELLSQPGLVNPRVRGVTVGIHGAPADHQIEVVPGPMGGGRAIDRMPPEPEPAPRFDVFGRVPGSPPPAPSVLHDANDFVNPIDPALPQEAKLAAIKELSAASRPLVEQIAHELNAALPGTETKVSYKRDAAILGKANRPTVLEDKPWYGVEHLRDALRFKTVLNSLQEVPGILARFREAGFVPVKIDTDKWIQPKGYGWRFVSADLRHPETGQLIEWYASPREFIQTNGATHKIYEKWRNVSPASLTAEQHTQLAADLTNVSGLYDNALEHYLERVGQTRDSHAAELPDLFQMMRSAGGELERAPDISLTSPAASAGGIGSHPPARLATSPVMASAARPNTQAPVEAGLTASPNVGSSSATEPLERNASIASPGVGTGDAGNIANYGRARQLSGTPGRTEPVRFSDGREVPAQYRVVDAAELQTSHDPFSFAQNPAYPSSVQGRAYHGPRGLAARQQVELNTRKLREREVLDAGAAAAEGPPVVTSDGTVIAGNQRAMLVSRAHQLEPERSDAYRAELKRRAAVFGVDPAAIDALEHPVLVREITDPQVHRENPDLLGELNRLSDTPGMKAKDVVSDADSRATAMRNATSSLGALERMEPDQTVREFLDTAGGQDFVRGLVADGVLAPQEVARFVDAASGRLTPHGKQTIEDTLRVAAIGNADLVHAASGAILGKLEHATPAIIRANAGDGGEMQRTLQEALQLLEQTGKGRTIRDVLEQHDFTQAPPSADAAALAEELATSRKAAITAKFREYGEAVAAHARGQQSADMFGHVPETPAAARARLFGGEQTPTLRRAGAVGGQPRQRSVRELVDGIVREKAARRTMVEETLGNLEEPVSFRVGEHFQLIVHRSAQRPGVIQVTTVAAGMPVGHVELDGPDVSAKIVSYLADQPGLRFDRGMIRDAQGRAGSLGNAELGTRMMASIAGAGGGGVAGYNAGASSEGTPEERRRRAIAGAGAGALAGATLGFADKAPVALRQLGRGALEARRGALDLFGNNTHNPDLDGPLFQAPKRPDVPLADLERLARQELDALQRRYRYGQKPAAGKAAEMAALQKLVNRGDAIGAGELRNNLQVNDADVNDALGRVYDRLQGRYIKEGTDKANGVQDLFGARAGAIGDQPETIRTAAIRTPEGRVFEGPLHVLAVEEARAAGAFGGKPPGVHGYTSGFLTSDGRFVSRTEATDIAERAQQRNVNYRAARRPVNEGELDSSDIAARENNTPREFMRRSGAIGAQPIPGVATPGRAPGAAPGTPPAYLGDADVQAVLAENARGMRQEPRTPTIDRVRSIYQGLVNSAASVGRVGEELGGGKELANEARRAKGTTAAALTRLETEFKPVLRQLAGHEEGVKALADAQRALELEGHGYGWKLGKVDPAAAARVVAKLEQVPEVKAGADALRGYYRSLLQRKLDNGVITPEQFQAITAKGQYYIPFVRDVPAGGAPDGMPRDGALFNRSTKVRRMEQGDADAPLLDPFRQAVLDTFETEKTIGKQRVFNVLADLVQKNPEAASPYLRELMPGQDAAAGREIRALVGGRQRRYEVVDDNLYDSLATLSPQVHSAAVRALGTVKRVLQAGVTSMPAFAIANAIRDSFMASVQYPLERRGALAGAAIGGALGAHEDQENPLRGAAIGAAAGFGLGNWAPHIARTLTALNDILGPEFAGANRKVYHEWMQEGGAGTTLTMRTQQDADKIVRQLQGIDQKGIIYWPKNAWDGLQRLNMGIEEATRLARYKYLTARGVKTSEAIAASRDVTLDFSQHGSSPLAELASGTTAFWNPKIQGYDKMFRTFNPATEEGRKAWAMGLAALTAPSVALWAINKDNPEYWTRPSWERNTFWLVPKEGGGFVRIPKPFELGMLFASLPERLLDFYHQRDPAKLTRALKDMGGTSLEGLVPIPTVAQPLLENTVNYSFFRQRPIVGAGLEKLPGELQYDGSTSSLAVKLGELTHYSPKKIDNLLASWTGGAGQEALNVTNRLARSSGADSRPLTGSERMTQFSRFVTQPDVVSDDMQLLRDRYGAGESVLAGIKALAKEGDGAKLRAFAVAHRDELRDYGQFRTAADQMDEIAKAKRMIQGRRDLPPSRKRELTARLTELATMIANAALAGRGAPALEPESDTPDTGGELSQP